jgi:C4-dicarboxylate-specific signal transduction histidine kinase
MKADRSEGNLISMLEFMGKVTASSTHEIKNHLAVINEQSRLLQEMLIMSRQGKEVNPDRLEQLIGRVVARVEQADQAVRRLNAFAHSADAELTNTDPQQTIAALLRIFERIASLKEITLNFDSVQNCGEIAQRPIYLEQTVWVCLESMVRQAEKQSELRVSLECEEDVLRVAFSLDPPVELQTPGEKLLSCPQGKVGLRQNGEMVLEAPIK